MKVKNALRLQNWRNYNDADKFTSDENLCLWVFRLSGVLASSFSLFQFSFHNRILTFFASEIYSMCITFWMYRGAIVANKEVI